MFLRKEDESTDNELNSNQREAIAVYKDAQKQELDGHGEVSWKLYKRAFQLWPRLETLDFDGLQ